MRLPWVCEIVPYMPSQKARNDTQEEWGEARQRWGLCSCKPGVPHLEEPLEAVLLGSLPFQALRVFRVRKWLSLRSSGLW